MKDILFTIPLPWAEKGLPIHSYGFMAMVSFMAALLVARWRAKRVGIRADTIMDMCITSLIAGIVGARIFFVAQFSEYYFDTSRPDYSFFNIFKVWQGGLVFYGGLFGAIAALVVVIRLKKERLLNVLDVMALSLCLGLGIARIGCLLHGCCYGIPLESNPWYAITFPDKSQPYLGGGAIPIASGTPLFPTQIVSCISLIVIFVILCYYSRHRRREGEVSALTLVLYGIYRFAVELGRGDTHLPGELSIAQWISFPVFFAGLALFVYSRSRPAPQPVEEPTQEERPPKRRRGKKNKKRGK